jgi:hypothetical protein
MTPERIAEIRERQDDFTRYERVNELEVARKIIGTDIPALLLAVETLQQDNARLRAALEEARQVIGYYVNQDENPAAIDAALEGK